MAEPDFRLCSYELLAGDPGSWFLHSALMKGCPHDLSTQPARPTILGGGGPARAEARARAHARAARGGAPRALLWLRGAVARASLVMTHG